MKGSIAVRPSERGTITRSAREHRPIVAPNLSDECVMTRRHRHGREDGRDVASVRYLPGSVRDAAGHVEWRAITPSRVAIDEGSAFVPDREPAHRGGMDRDERTVVVTRSRSNRNAILG